MSAMAAPAGWYPDPDGSGGQRYFDGADWTGHRVPPQGTWTQPHWTQPGAYPWGVPPWKGAELGRPPYGPGSLADPGRRLGARLLDGLIMIPVFAALVAIAVAVVAPHAGPIFPNVDNNGPNAPAPTPGILWIYLAVFVAGAVAVIVSAAYQVVATARYGRTLGKMWLGIRPLRTDGGTLGWGRALGREAIYAVSHLFSWIGALDPLWCLWDANRQCLHDKVASTMVVND
jgi:uncharacterized RDD family membrane protein YckC